jgi:hypothetical protein
MTHETIIIEGERLEIVEIARQGLPGPPGAGGGTALIRLAGETLSALRAVWEDAAGRVWLLDAHDAAHIALFAGITISSGNVGDAVTIQRAGVIDAAGLGLVPGRVWVGANGALTQIVPASGFDLYIGAALSNQRLVISPSEPIRSS